MSEGSGTAPRTVELPRERLTRWVGDLLDRHGAPTWSHDADAIVITCADGTVARLTALDPAGASQVSSLRTLVGWPAASPRLALVLVRRGRYALGLADGTTFVAHTAGSRYVQSRTAAGGWSQQRYARRRANQADALVEHVVTCVLRMHQARAVGGSGLGWAQALAVGGDRGLVDRVLADPRLAAWTDLARYQAFDIPDPTHEVLRSVLARARCVQVGVTDPVRQPVRVDGRVSTMTSTEMSSARRLLPAAAASVTDLVERLSDEAWSRPSPCEGWSVRDVLGHLTAEHLWAPRLLAGETLGDVGSDYDGDVLGSDPVGAWHAAVDRSLASWDAVEDESRVLRMSFGPCPIHEYAEQMLVDLTVHGWDLARGAGARWTAVPEAVDACLRYETPRVSGGGVEGIFAPPMATGSRDRLDQLVALLGREPGWRA
ncbi:acVLRF1 family peptidyl-tRNA hydrolase [Arsenicicoccus dermatophilus]|uniref:acVLRF1 family peptidyl-tRNA hydrolase n=1 Tax=Arsenicicoccus dermatophilus TaxID=1076331 RepID=UPI001F4CEA7C|nr:acVLRF1 family peptidyl-tRNA hydrolase [Arsenicicoccus dermatophilus]MCH8612566.1 TIGR03086 family metal-binding protein [Arsenicicoccus dermatophilus]